MEACESHRQTVIVALKDVVVMDVSGDDAGSWLQGQLTQDISGLQGNDQQLASNKAASQAVGAQQVNLNEIAPSVYSFLLTRQGRVLADLFVCARGETFRLVFEKALLAHVEERFESHIIMEDVDLEPKDDIAVFTIQGHGAENVVNALRERKVLAHCTVVEARRLDTGVTRVPGFDLQVSTVYAPALEGELSRLVSNDTGSQTELAEVAFISEEQWHDHRLFSGRPDIARDLLLPLPEAPKFLLPQETGLADLAVSFAKGCYLGQEAVVMLEHRGKLKRQLACLRWPVQGNRQPPSVGEKLLDDSGRELGSLVSGVKKPRSGQRALLALLSTTVSSSQSDVVLRAVPSELMLQVQNFVGR